MAQSKLSISNAEKDLECAICMSDLTEPKLLPCLHTFCMTCLKRYYEGIYEEVIPCPLCSTEFIFPEEGVETLKTDQVKIRLVLEKQTREGKQKLSSCDTCENTNVEAYCVECLQCLCSACRNVHLRNNSTKTHSIVGMDEKPSEAELQKIKSQFCTTHAGKQIELYCCDCEKLLCYSCHATEHKTHLCKLPSEVAKSKCKEIEEDRNRMKKCIEEEIKKVNEFKTAPMTYIEEISKVEKVVEDSFAVIIKYLEKEKSKLLTIYSLREMREEKLKAAESEDYVSEFRCAELNSFLEYSRMVIERGTDYEILAIANELHNRADDLVQTQEKPNEKEVPLTNLKLLTNISSKIEELRNEILEMQAINWTRLLNNSYVDSFNAAGGSPFGIVIHNNEVYMICYDTPHILVYSLQNLFTVSRQISVPGLTHARGLVYNESDSCLYASNYSHGHIYKINTCDNSVTGWASLYKHPWGLSVSKQKNLLVSYYYCAQIDEFNGSGQLIRSIKLTDGIIGIYHSVELETGEFIVCQRAPLHRISLVDSSGRVIKFYGKEEGSGVGQLNNPRHVELDQKGNILVSDWGNSKLRVLTSDLKYVSDVKIIDTKFEFPTCTCWDKDNDRLLVTTLSGLCVITPQNL